MFFKRKNVESKMEVARFKWVLTLPSISVSVFRQNLSFKMLFILQIQCFPLSESQF